MYLFSRDCINKSLRDKIRNSTPLLYAMRTRNTNNIDLWNIQCKKSNNKKRRQRVDSRLSNWFFGNSYHHFRPKCTISFSATVSKRPAPFSLKFTIIITLLNLV